jgi:hypothetical protein
MTVRVLLCLAALILSTGGLRADQPTPELAPYYTSFERIYITALQVEVAASQLEQSRERAAWADRMVKLKYMSPSQALAERERLVAAELAVLKARDAFRELASPKPGK